MITQRVRVLNNTTNVLYFNTTSLFNKLELYSWSALPGWITENISPFITYLTLNPATTGTYTYYFTESSSPPAQDACLIIEVVDSLTDLAETCSSSNNITLIWITREGGIATYIFDQRKDYKGILGDTETFDNNGILKYFKRGKNFVYKQVYKTGLTNSEVDLLESLRYSIQAWEHNPTTGVNTPILLDSINYDLYAEKGQLNRVTLKYRIAEYKEIQSQ